MTSVPPNYFNDGCFSYLDEWIKTATDAGLWVILAVRGEYIAGQDFKSDPGSSIFRNETLQNMMYAAWRHVAAHYSSFDRIAAYELLSEPRDKTVGADAVRGFYEGACSAVRLADPRTPCMVGGAPYYKLWTFGDDVILKQHSNSVIYTFDYFDPDAFVFARGGEGLVDAIPSYGSQHSYSCKDLYSGWVTQVCPTWNITSPATQIPFDKAWHDHNLRTFALPLRSRHQVPIFLNQFEVVHGVTEANGRYAYIEDLLTLTRQYGIGWAWWTWEGGNSKGWSHGSSEIVFRWPNGTVMVDTRVLESMNRSW